MSNYVVLNFFIVFFLYIQNGKSLLVLKTHDQHHHRLNLRHNSNKIELHLQLMNSKIESIGYNTNTNSTSSSILVDIGNSVYDGVSNFAEMMVFPGSIGRNETKRFIPIQAALQKIQKDMEFLDDVAGRTPQLSTAEFVVLITTVLVSACSPIAFTTKVTELLVPSMAAISAAIGISAEYVGKVAVANGKETAAAAIQATAESEILLAQAERVKAILPLCVGIATTASALALLAPTFVAEMTVKYSITFATEAFFFFPLVAVLAAAISGLATQEALGLASNAVGTGNRRFASSTSVGRTWLSTTEKIASNSARQSMKWTSFAVGVAPAPIISAIFPGTLGLKAIVCAAIAAAQAAYYLATAEYAIAEATNAVALKARSAAVADTYANQGSRSGAILPFTSALGGLCAAASAAVIEVLPILPVDLQPFLAVLFPSAAALFAAAASVSKARCEVSVDIRYFHLLFLFLYFILMFHLSFY